MKRKGREGEKEIWLKQMEYPTGRRNSTANSLAGFRLQESRKTTIADVCTFVRFVYGGERREKTTASDRWNEERRSISKIDSLDNQQILLNSYASCRRLLDHMKQIAGIHPDGKEKYLNEVFRWLMACVCVFRNGRCDGQWRQSERIKCTLRWLCFTIPHGSIDLLHLENRR